MKFLTSDQYQQLIIAFDNAYQARNLELFHILDIREILSQYVIMDNLEQHTRDKHSER